MVNIKITTANVLFYSLKSKSFTISVLYNYDAESCITMRIFHLIGIRYVEGTRAPLGRGRMLRFTVLSSPQNYSITSTLQVYKRTSLAFYSSEILLYFIFFVLSNRTNGEIELALPEKGDSM